MEERKEMMINENQIWRGEGVRKLEEEEEEVGVGSRKTVTFCCYVKRMARSNDGCFLEGGRG